MHRPSSPPAAHRVIPAAAAATAAAAAAAATAALCRRRRRRRRLQLLLLLLLQGLSASNLFMDEASFVCAAAAVVDAARSASCGTRRPQGPVGARFPPKARGHAPAPPRRALREQSADLPDAVPAEAAVRAAAGTTLATSTTEAV